MSTVQSQDIIKSSAISFLTPPPQARSHQVEVAKLIDVTTCIGCKACQVGCSEWNDIRSTWTQLVPGSMTTLRISIRRLGR